MNLIDKIKSMTRQQKMVAVGLGATVVLTLLVVILIVGIFAGNNSAGNPPQPAQTAPSTQGTEPTAQQTVAPTTEEMDSSETTDTVPDTTATEPENDDPQVSPSGNTEPVDISSVITGDGENKDRTFGIDVSKYQGTIDWSQVADYGIEFAMVRVGYRTKTDGTITADANAAYNLQQAAKYGIKLGAYFFSTAITEQEAVEEANWVASYIAQYPITYPVAFNCEGFSDPQSRQYSLSKTQRTDLALAFLKTIHQKGYTPMFYAAKVELEGQAQWETNRIQKQYKIWVAQYPAQPYPQTQQSSYSGRHHMWQFTPSGSIPGISQGVDLNIAYFGYDSADTPQDETPPPTAEADPEALMAFRDIQESVTAKIETNLRSAPSQGSDSQVLYTLKNGQIATRTGISDSGWSRVEWDGKVYYAVSSYLTTDLNYAPPETTQPQTEFQTQFTPANRQVTAKDVVNLRDIPSMENSQVVAQLKNGEIATCTGVNEDVGWARIQWNEQTLYCIYSYLTDPQVEAESTEAQTDPSLAE